MKRSQLFALGTALTLLGQSVVATAPAMAGPRGDVLAQETPTPAAPAAPAGPPYHAASPEYGVVVHVFGQPTLDRDLALAHDAGFKWVTVEMPWANMEPQRQTYDWAEADRVVKSVSDHNLQIIARLDVTPGWARADGKNNGPPDNYQDFADFVSSFVRHFRKDPKRVQAVEVWNEPNIAREWGDQPPNPQQYVQLLQVTHKAAKDASENITVMTGALTPTGTSDATSMPDQQFLEEMYTAGAQPYFDVLTAHAAGYKAAPEKSPDEVAADKTLGGQRFFAFRHAEDLHNTMVAHNDGNKQVWVTEFGWTTDTVHPDYAWFANDEATKADYIVRAFQYARTNWAPWIGVMTVWTLAAPYWTTDNEQYYWAIDNPDGTPRPAYDKFKEARTNGTLP